MLRVIGITKHYNSVGFVVWNDETGLPSFIDVKEMLMLLKSDASAFLNVGLVDSKITALDVPFDKMPVYGMATKYMGTQPVFTVLEVNGSNYRLLTNSFTVESVEESKIKALLNKDKSFICNCYLSDDKPVVIAPKKIAKPDSHPTKANNEKPLSEQFTRVEYPASTGLVLCGSFNKNSECIVQPMSWHVDDESLMNTINAIGDLFIGFDGIGAWAYHSAIIRASAYISNDFNVINNIQLSSITEVPANADRKFWRVAHSRFDTLNHQGIIDTLMCHNKLEFYTKEQLMQALYNLAGEIGSLIVRNGDEGINSPINVDCTLENFKNNEFLWNLRKVGLREY